MLKIFLNRLKLVGHVIYHSFLFGLATFSKRGRGTHTKGVGAKGKLVITTTPQFPSHAFFKPGKTFRALVRHANLSQLDDLSSDARGASIKLDEGWDLLMNTGETTPWANASMFKERMKALLKDKLATYFNKYPEAKANLIGALRRAPNSYSECSYYANIAYPFTDNAGILHCARYRLVPKDYSGTDSGPLTVADLENPLNQVRLPEEKRPEDTLRQEFKSRLEKGPITYQLEMQLRDYESDFNAELYNPMKPWSAEQFPWLPLGVLTLEEALSDEQTERLSYNIVRTPVSMGVFKSGAPEDYTSIGYLRTRVYKIMWFFRRIAYLLPKKKKPPSKNLNTM